MAVYENHDILIVLLLIGRVLCGLSTGIASFIVPLYSKIHIVRELAPVEIYAKLGAINQFMITFGIFSSYSIGYYSNITVDYIPLFTFPILLSLLQTLLFIFKYPKETPTYLMMCNKKREALVLVNHLYFNKEIEEENSEEILMNSQINHNYKSVTYAELFKTLNLTKSLKMGCIISVLQQFTGINYIIVNSSNYINIGNKELVTILIGLTNMVFGSISVFLLKKHYKKNLQAGAAGMCICYLLVICSVWNQADFKSIYIVFMFLFIVCFELSIGPIMWIYCADVLSDKGVAITSGLNWISVLVVLGVFSAPEESNFFAYKSYNHIPFVFMNLFFLGSCSVVRNT